MLIAGREIGPGQPPYVIAEISCNHGGSLDNALHLIDAAKEAGADAVKFQCYTPDTITLDCDRPDFIVRDGPWKGRRLYELYGNAHTPFGWFPPLAEYARNIGITWLSSVFDATAVDLLESLGCPAYKIASFEIVDLPLIRHAAATGKPLIISTGMATLEEIKEAVATVICAPDPIPWTKWDQESSIQRPAVLHCVSGYPTQPAEANLPRIAHLSDELACAVGLSDHTTGIEIPIAATALGACIIEKHLMLPGVPTEDAAFSLTPDCFATMVRAVRSTWAALQPSTAASEAPSRQLRRSLYAVRQIAAQEPFSTANVRSIRPGYGLPPKHLPEIIGRPAKRDIVRGEALTWEMVK